MPKRIVLNNISIIPAKTKEDFIKGRTLFLDYQKSLDFKIDFQDFNLELKNIDKQYALPTGVLLLAKYQEQTVGCIALRKLKNHTAELKRMYVQPEFRETGIGFSLLKQVLDKAKEMGYQKVRLDSLKRMKKAVELYKYFGFYTIKPYRFNPMKDALFMEKELD